jgi:hypothetical protein
MIEDAQPMAREKASDEGVDLPRLTGKCLHSARVAWIVLALAALGILLSSLPGYVQGFGGLLNPLAVDAQSTGALILTALGGLASLASALLSLALATVFFRRRFAEPIVATLSTYLLLYAVIMAGPLEIWSTYWLGDLGLVPTMQGLLLAGPSVALLALFPNGRLVPAWTGWLLLLTIPWSLSLFFVPSFDAGSLSEQSPLVLALLAGGLLGLFMAGLFAQAVRYRHVSVPAERQQTKWVIYGLALWLACLLLTSIP